MTRTLHIRPRSQRGIALLLVMIGLVVCSLLTAGFLSSQGTAISIARNERDAEAARLLAQTGIDLCYAEIRNNSSWRETLSPGTWLNNASIGNGVVTVSATSGDGGSTFSADPTQSVVFRSTATCNGRSFTLVGTISPTGAGTVFRSGHFMAGNIQVGDGSGTSTVDSYDSSVAAYNALLPGSDAVFGSNGTTASTLTINFPSVYRGTFIAGPGAVLGSVVNLVGAVLYGPSSTTAAAETRSPGAVIAPNFAGAGAAATLSTITGNTSILPGVYSDVSASSSRGTAIVTLSSGNYQFHNLTIGTTANLAVPANANVVMYVTNNTTLSGAVTLGSGATLTVYTAGNMTFASAINNNGSTKAVKLLGTGSGGVQLNSGATIFGVLYAPNSSVAMSGTPQLYGAVIAHDITMKGTSQIHFDKAIKDLTLKNLNGGSAPAGVAEYSYKLSSGY